MATEIIYKLLNELPEFYEKDETTTTYQYMYSLALEFEDVEDTIDDLNSAIFVDTSTGQYLNDLARLFRLSRKSDETDAELRSRIKGYWPGFSGGGTIDAFKQTVNRITGVSIANVDVNEIDFMKLVIDIVLDGTEQYTLIETIDEILQDIKAAGTWLDSRYVLTGAPLSDELTIGEAISFIESGTGIFTAGASVAGGQDVA